MSYESIDVNLRVGNVTQNKNGTIINVSVSAKNQQHIVLVKNIISGMLVDELANVMKIVTG